MSENKFFNVFKIIDKKTINNLKKFILIAWKSYRKQWELALTIILLGAILKLPMPFLTKYIIDKVISTHNFNHLALICGIILFVTILFLISDSIKDFILFRVSYALTIRYNLMLLKHIQTLSNKFLYKNESGYLMARVLSDPSQLSTIFIDTTLTIIQSVVVFIVCLIAIFYLNWELSLFVLVFIPFYVFSHLLFINKIKYWNGKIKEQNADIFKNLKETISAIPTIKLFMLEPIELLRFFRNLRVKFKYNTSEFRLQIIVGLIVSFFSSLIPLIVFGYGGYEIMKGDFTIGGLIAYSSLLGYIFSPVRAVINTHISLQTSLVSLNRIYDILNIENEDSKFVTNYHIRPVDYSIEYRNVTFQYDDDDKYIFKNFSIKIGQNQKIAFTGPIGSGKTTFVNLLNRFILPNEGDIFIGGINIKEFDRKILSTMIGYVSQDIFLFSTSILENIRIGNPKIGRDEVLRIAKLCQIDEFVNQFPNKYDTIVGENGVFLSGGQKQLISIARVLLKNPKILVLDEPTSAIDITTEQQIYNVLSGFVNNCTYIIISHKNKLIENADIIVSFLDNQFTIQNEKSDKFGILFK